MEILFVRHGQGVHNLNTPESWGIEHPRLTDRLGTGFIEWCENQPSKRILIITHDGTINNYRELLGETNLTRNDFLGEAGWYKISVDE